MWCFVSLFLVVSTSAFDCLESLIAEMTYYVSSGMLNPTHSVTQFDCIMIIILRNQTWLLLQSRMEDRLDDAIHVLRNHAEPVTHRLAQPTSHSTEHLFSSNGLIFSVGPTAATHSAVSWS